MIEIAGKYNTAFVHSDIIELTCFTQLLDVCNCKLFENETIHVMPDVHAGKGSVIGFTSTFNNQERVCPNIIGVDIGCGVDVYNLGNIDLDLQQFDYLVKTNVPSGTEVRTTNRLLESTVEQMLFQLRSPLPGLYFERALNSIGTLGGGNHFLEIDVDRETNEHFLVIHSGSRQLGKLVAEYYQKIATQYENEGKSLYSVSGVDKDNYLHDMKIAQQYAAINRMTIADVICKHLNIPVDLYCTSVHNYIDFDDNIIRKGAISAHTGQKIVIPLNMRDGIILATGKQTSDTNYSAPHGAGRLFSRGQAKQQITLEQFQQSMVGIYSSCITSSTIDESPFAYKDSETIINQVSELVDIDRIIKPIYNFKGK